VNAAEHDEADPRGLETVVVRDVVHVRVELEELPVPGLGLGAGALGDEFLHPDERRPFLGVGMSQCNGEVRGRVGVDGEHLATRIHVAPGQRRHQRRLSRPALSRHRDLHPCRTVLPSMVNSPGTERLPARSGPVKSKPRERTS